MKHFLKNAHFLLTPYFVDFSVNRSSKWALHFLAWCSITAAIPSTIYAFLPADAAKSLEVLTATLLDHSPDNSKDPAIIVGWPGLDLQLSGKIIWTSSNVKLRSPGRRSCIAKGRDDNGPVELIIVEREGYYTATFRDGSGTLGERCLSMLLRAGLPVDFWWDAYETSNYLTVRLPHEDSAWIYDTLRGGVRRGARPIALADMGVQGLLEAAEGLSTERLERQGFHRVLCWIQ